MVKSKDNPEELEGAPLCEKCGEPMTKEEGSWICPHCQGEIDFMGDDDE